MVSRRRGSRSPRRSERRGGFSLIELTVATAVLAVGLSLALGAAARCLHGTRVAHARERALRAAAHVADSLCAMTAPAPGSIERDGVLLSWAVGAQDELPRVEVTASPSLAPARPVTLYAVGRVELP